MPSLAPFGQAVSEEKIFLTLTSHSIIELVTEYKYFGILFKNTGILKCASENLADRARKAYYSLKSKIS
jgi:hypothetical protein